jgi:hypothetical protein
LPDHHLNTSIIQCHSLDGFPVAKADESAVIDPNDDFFSPERREKRRKMLEITKATFADRPPLSYSPEPKILTHDHQDGI